MVALTFMSPALTVRADGDESVITTRPFNVSVNAVIPEEQPSESSKTVADVQPVKAMSFAELRKAQKKVAAK